MQQTESPQQQQSKPKRGTKTKLYFYYQTAAGTHELSEFDDKVQLDAFLEQNQVTPIYLIRGSMRAFKNRLVLV